MGWGLQDMCDTLTAERDAALARVAVLEAGLDEIAIETDAIVQKIHDRDPSEVEAPIATMLASIRDAARKALEASHD